MADGADFDSCGCLDKNHPPIPDPQPSTRPPRQSLDVARSGLGKPLDLGLYIGSHIERKLTKGAPRIVGPCYRLHEAHYTKLRSDNNHKISK